MMDYTQHSDLSAAAASPIAHVEVRYYVGSLHCFSIVSDFGQYFRSGAA